MKLKKHKTCFSLCAVIILLLAAANTIVGQQNTRADSSVFSDNKSIFSRSFQAPNLSVKKSLEMSGGNIFISGNGYGGFERVTLTVESYIDSLEQNAVLMQWDVFADRSGEISSYLNFDALNSISGRYTLKAFGNDTKTSAAVNLESSTNIGVNFEQCANGPQTAPISCNVSSGNDGYTRGNLTASKAHYFEGDSVPIRIIATGLTAGQSYTVTIAYDFTSGGKYAFDYLTDYNRTEAVNNNPCVGVSGCTLASAQTFPIPIDPFVQANAATGQIPGNFTIFGGTITNVSGYSTTVAGNGDITKYLTITFTANQENVVIAYGAHISTRDDWGVNNSAIAITGSPYHNFIQEFPGANQGNRDLQISEDAVIYPGRLIIVKNTSPAQSDYQFPFMISGQISSMFNLDTDPNTATPDSNTSSIVFFGNQNSVTVKEGQLSNGWSLRSRQCVDAGNGLGASSISYNSNGNDVTISFTEGAYVTCTFTNDLLLAAGASVSGRVINSYGSGFSRISVSAMSLSTGETVYTTLDRSGSYLFEGLSVNDSYLISVSAKNLRFEPSSKVVTLSGDLADIDFVAAPVGITRTGKR